MRPIFGTFLLTLTLAMSCSASELTLNQAKAHEIFARLIAFKTEVGQGQVPVMAEYLAGEFKSAGFPAEDIHILPLGETASLVVRYHGNGKGGRPIALLAHMDVVTAKPEDWRRDPYALIEENGYFYGRGSLDIKNDVALLTATFLRLKHEHFVPTRDFIIVFSGDEETGMLTAKDLTTQHRDLIDAEFALNSDGGGGVLNDQGQAQLFALQTAEKSYASFEISTHNPGGHSSLPRSDNAIYELADAIKALQAYRFPVQWNDTTRAYFKASGVVTPGAVGAAMRRFAQDPTDHAATDVLFDTPAEVGRTRTTCIPTLLRGGHADNALPQSATVTVNCRIFPGVAVVDVGKILQAQVGSKVDVKVLGNPTVSDASPLRTDVLAAVTRAVHAMHPGVAIIPAQDSYATDGVYFRAAGIPTYGVAGTFIKDSDVFSHGLNERIPVQSFYDEMDYWYRLLKDFGGR